MRNLLPPLVFLPMRNTCGAQWHGARTVCGGTYGDLGATHTSCQPSCNFVLPVDIGRASCQNVTRNVLVFSFTRNLFIF
jgi:hypothetical protein